MIKQLYGDGVVARTGARLDEELGLGDRLDALCEREAPAGVGLLAGKGVLGQREVVVDQLVAGPGDYALSRLTRPQTRVVKTLNDFEVEVVEASGVDPIRVKELAFSLGQPGAWIVSPGTMRRSDVTRVSRGEAPSISHLGWFVVNAKPRDDVAAMFRLVKAIEGKIAQVRRRAENVLGLMVAITDLERAADRHVAALRVGRSGLGRTADDGQGTQGGNEMKRERTHEGILLYWFAVNETVLVEGHTDKR